MPEAALRAVLARPRDDAARAAFARAVAAVDPQRADLVTVQLEVARLRRAGAAEARREALDRRADQLLQAHGRRWGGPLQGIVPQGDPWSSAWTWRRGFVEGLRMPPRAFLEAAEALFGIAPVLDLVATSADGVLDLLGHPVLARLRSLSCFNLKLGDPLVEALVRSPHAGGLAWLDLGFNRLGDGAVEALAAARNLPALRHVRFTGNPCADPNPTLDEGEGVVHGTLGSPRALDLRARHGAVAWLGPWPSSDPPDPEAVG